MANYFNLTYESTAASSPGNVELNYGNSFSNGLTVQASLYAGDGFTPIDYKIWGIELVKGEGVVTLSGAEWLPYTDTRTVRLASHNDPQTASVIFRNAGMTETDVFQSNDVTFTFVQPIIHDSTEWKDNFEDLGFDSAVANTLTNTTYKTEVEFAKGKIDQLLFSGRDFSGLVIEEDTIRIDSGSQIGQIIGLKNTNYVSVTKGFENTAKPMIMVDSGSGYVTLTAYDGTVKSTLSGIDASRLSNVTWTAGTKTLEFDVNYFSTYGFCTIQKMEFTNDSQTGGYVNSTATIKVYVQDTNGEPVENAPVTISGIGDNIGSFQESMPVDTGADGIAEFTLNVSTAGSATYEANVDGLHFTDPDITVFGLDLPSAQRSLLTQYEQIRRSAIYTDTVSGVNTVDVAEPSTTTYSGSADSVLEHDLNVLRTLIKQVKGTSDWFSELPTHFKPEDTNVASDELGTVTMDQIAGNTLDAKTIIMAVSDSNSGNGFSVSPGDEGVLLTVSTRYATPDNRTGLPVFASTANNGTYYDEGGNDEVVLVDVLDMNTSGEFSDVNGDIIYGKLHDGADYSGSGDGTDVYVRLYTDSGPYTVTSGDPNSIMVVYPYRKTMASVEEYEWARTDFVSSWEGDEVLIDDISNLWAYTGTLNNESSPNWTVISGSPMVTSNETSLKDGLEAINTEISDRIFTEENYITSGQSITDSLDALDTSIYDISQLASAGIGDVYSVVLASDLPAETAYQLPVGVTYTPDSTVGQQGKNMDVYLDGQLLTADTGTNGANADKDYSETSTTHVTFHYDLYQYSNITFRVRS